MEQGSSWVWDISYKPESSCTAVLCPAPSRSVGEAVHLQGLSFSGSVQQCGLFRPEGISKTVAVAQNA